MLNDTRDKFSYHKITIVPYETSNYQTYLTCNNGNLQHASITRTNPISFALTSSYLPVMKRGNISLSIVICTRVKMLEASTYQMTSGTCQLPRRPLSIQLSSQRLAMILMASVDYSWTIGILLLFFSSCHESSSIFSLRVLTGRIT